MLSKHSGLERLGSPAVLLYKLYPCRWYHVAAIYATCLCGNAQARSAEICLKFKASHESCFDVRELNLTPPRHANTSSLQPHATGIGRISFRRYAKGRRCYNGLCKAIDGFTGDEAIPVRILAATTKQVANDSAVCLRSLLQLQAVYSIAGKRGKAESIPDDRGRNVARQGVQPLRRVCRVGSDAASRSRAYIAQATALQCQDG